MKFCIVYDNLLHGYVGHEYEQPYSYSEYTSGGGCFNHCGRLSREDLFNTDDNDGKRVFIFENKEVADKWIKAYGDNISRFKVVLLKDV